MRDYTDLPEEISFNIFYRLPAKSIGSCRCVSNSWLALLSRPGFIRTHLEVWRNVQEDSLVIILESPRVRYSLSYVSLNDACHLPDEITVSEKRLKFTDNPNSWLQIHATCDGLVLLEDYRCNIAVLNPLTRQIRIVAVSPLAILSRIYGFGYDPVTDDYKIVIMYLDYGVGDYTNSTTLMNVEVFSLKTNTWKNVDCSFYQHADCRFSSGVFVNGYIHWLTCREVDTVVTLVAFDLVQEKFHELPLPVRADNGNLVLACGLDVLGGDLCTYNVGDPDFWVMKAYGVEESWTKLFINHPEPTVFKPLCMLGQDEIVLKGMKNLFVYNLKDGGRKDIVIGGKRPKLRSELSFGESLVSPYYPTWNE